MLSLRVGIVGSGEDKFTEIGKKTAKNMIAWTLYDITTNWYCVNPVTVVSGHSIKGGVDIWAEEIADAGKLNKLIFAPKVETWDTPKGCYGYKARNLDIAKSDVVYVVVANKYPRGYYGQRFNECYHCHRTDHVKSGGCWTGKKAVEFGNKAYWIVVDNGE